MADRARRKRCRAQKEEKERKKREGIIVVVRSPCQENYPADAHPSVHKSVLESANPAWTRPSTVPAPEDVGCEGTRGGGGCVDCCLQPEVVPTGPGMGGQTACATLGHWGEGRHVYCTETAAGGGKGGGGGLGTRPRYLIVCLWRRLLASRHCSF